MRKYSVGDVVLCQYYNTMDRRFYGEKFEAKIVEVGGDNYQPKRDFTVQLEDDRLVTIWRNEIKKRIQ